MSAKAARSSKGAFDKCVRNSVIQRVKEPDVLASVGDCAGYAFERPGLAGEIGAIVDDRDGLGRCHVIPDGQFLKEMHDVLTALSKDRSRELNAEHYWDRGRQCRP